MLHTLTFTEGDNRISFRFEKFSNLMTFLEIAAETVDGFDQGKTTISISMDEETPTEGNL